MRTWFWTLAVFVAAVALALLLRDHSGNVLIVAQPWRIELSLTLAVLLLLVLFLAAYLLVRALAWVGGGPERFRTWRHLRAQKRDYELLESGWLNVLEGRYGDAEKELGKLVARSHVPERRVLAALAAARSAHQQGEFSRRDQSLQQAREAASREVRLGQAVALVTAEMYLDENRPEDALLLLQPLQDASTHHLQATRLLLRAHRQLGQHDRVYDLTRLLLRRGVIDRAEALPLIETSTAARLHAAGLEGYKAVWSDLKPEERTLPDIALAAASLQAAAGMHEEASRILEAAIAQQPEPRLLAAYSQCPPDMVARRLSKAEVWLKSNPDDPALLAALGNLCLIGQLWGQGEHYLLRSMQLRSDIRIHALLGNLYDRLGRAGDAMKHWRLASGVAGVLPVLASGKPLPAADTRSDPTLIDVESIPEPRVDASATGIMPVAASAADYSHDDSPEPAAPRESPQAASPDSDGYEYFDSAPIPGVDVSQTSDRTSGSR